MRFLLRLRSVSDTPVRVGIDYRRRFISLLKRILKDEYEKVKARPYTFAVYFGKEARINKDFIEGVGHINFRFSTGDSILAVKFYNGALALKKQGSIHSVGEGKFVVDWIRQEEERDPTGVYKTLSPVVVERMGFTSRTPTERFIIPSEGGFEESLLNTIFRRYREIKGADLKVSKFAFESLRTREEFVKHYGGYVRGFIGKFKILSDSQELLRFIYQYGLGFRTGQGFGYLEVEDGKT